MSKRLGGIILSHRAPTGTLWGRTGPEPAAGGDLPSVPRVPVRHLLGVHFPAAVWGERDGESCHRRRNNQGSDLLREVSYRVGMPGTSRYKNEVILMRVGLRCRFRASLRMWRTVCRAAVNASFFPLFFLFVVRGESGRGTALSSRASASTGTMPATGSRGPPFENIHSSFVLVYPLAPHCLVHHF